MSNVLAKVAAVLLTNVIDCLSHILSDPMLKTGVTDVTFMYPNYYIHLYSVGSGTS